MGFKLTGSKQRAAFTLVEFMVAVPLMMLMLAGMVTLYCYTTRSFASLTTYSALDQKTRYAGDIISRDVRSASSVDAATTNNVLVLNTLSGTKITYLYDQNFQTLVRSNSAGTTLLLSNLVSLNFSLYQRPTNSLLSYESFPAANAGSAKLIGFNWKTSQRIVTSESDSQDMQAGIVELRNQ